MIEEIIFTKSKNVVLSQSYTYIYITRANLYCRILPYPRARPQVKLGEVHQKLILNLSQYGYFWTLMFIKIHIFRVINL